MLSISLRPGAVSYLEPTRSFVLRVNISKHDQVLNFLLTEVIPGVATGLLEKPVLSDAVLV